MHTRQDYLNGKCTHREYYDQFVTPGTRYMVATFIGKERITTSTDEHFNDIPLITWDALVSKAPGSELFKKAGDFYTQAGGVCLLKEAAQQIRDATRKGGANG